MAPLPEIHLSALSYTLEHWLPRTGIPGTGLRAHDPLDLAAPYQRGSVWTLGQRQALVKSLYMGVPIGAVIVSTLPYQAGREADWRVVDGKQRVEAIRAWAADEFAVPGDWFAEEYLEQPGALTVSWSGLSVRGQRKFQGCMVPGLQFDAERVWLGFGPGEVAPGKDDRERRWGKRTEAEMLVAEAELYALINGGGTPQTAEDMARAADVARGAQP